MHCPARCSPREIFRFPARNYSLRFSVDSQKKMSIFPDVWLKNAMGGYSLQFEYRKNGIREIEGERTPGH
jgi:hypothetical protein